MGSTGAAVQVQLPPFVKVDSSGDNVALPFIPVQLDPMDPTRETMLPLEGKLVVRPEQSSYEVAPKCSLDSREEEEAMWYSEGENEDVTEASPVLAPRAEMYLMPPVVIEEAAVSPVPQVFVKDEATFNYPQTFLRKDADGNRYYLADKPFTPAGDDEPERLWVSCLDYGRILYRTFKVTWGPADNDQENCEKLKKQINKRGLVTKWTCVQEYNHEKQIYQMAATGHRPQGPYSLLANAIKATFDVGTLLSISVTNV